MNFQDTPATIPEVPTDTQEARSPFGLCPLSGLVKPCGQSCAWFDPALCCCAVVSIAKRK